MDPDWRCISYWKWGYSIAMLVSQRVFVVCCFFATVLSHNCHSQSLWKKRQCFLNRFFAFLNCWKGLTYRFPTKKSISRISDIMKTRPEVPSDQGFVAFSWCWESQIFQSKQMEILRCFGPSDSQRNAFWRTGWNCFNIYSCMET